MRSIFVSIDLFKKKIKKQRFNLEDQNFAVQT